MRRPELPIDLGTATMTCTPDDVGAIFAALLAEMRTVTPLLRPDERFTEALALCDLGRVLGSHRYPISPP